MSEQVGRLRDRDASVRRGALEALERTGPQDSELAPALAKAVLHRVLGVERVARVLGRIEPDPAVALPPLLGLLKEPVSRRRAAAAQALADIGEPAAAQAVPALTRLLSVEQDESVREHASAALERLARDSAGPARPSGGGGE